MNAVSPPGFTPEDLVAILPMLHNFARRFYHNTTDAEDLVQETIIKALASRHRFSQGTSLKSWMFTIMRNTFCTRIQRARREVAGGSDCVAAATSVKPSQEWSLQMAEFNRAFADLSELHQETLQLIVFEGQSYEAVAERHHCPVGTVKSRLNRAREKLARSVDIGGLSSADARTPTTAMAWKTA